MLAFIQNFDKIRFYIKKSYLRKVGFTKMKVTLCDLEL